MTRLKFYYSSTYLMQPDLALDVILPPPCCKNNNITVIFLNIQTPKTSVVITLKFELCGSTIE